MKFNYLFDPSKEYKTDLRLYFIEHWRLPIGNDFDVISKMGMVLDLIKEMVEFSNENHNEVGDVYFYFENTCHKIYNSGVLSREYHKADEFDGLKFQSILQEDIDNYKESIRDDYKSELEDKDKMIKMLYDYLWHKYKSLNHERLIAKLISGTKLTKCEVKKYPDVIDMFEAYERLDCEIKHLSLQ